METLFLNSFILKKKNLNYHLDRRRDFPEPGPPETSNGGIGAGAATRSFRRSKYCKKEAIIIYSPVFKGEI